jgi:hypothetical protein
MGTVYAIVCDEVREKIDPSSISGNHNKLHRICEPGHPIGAVALFALWSRWEWFPITLAADTAVEDPLTGLQPYDDYRDVTSQVLAAYNDYYDTDLQYTP